jgi:hypothetical protein
MTALRLMSQRTGALVVGIDHFGKVVETGTRGSSAKEGAADLVVALLADRELSGGVKNTRLAVRKQRDGVSGFEVPFTVRMMEPHRSLTGRRHSRRLGPTPAGLRRCRSCGAS